MTASGWIMQLLLGGLLGTTGQAIRVVVGLKKLNDKAQREGLTFGEAFSPSTLALSLLIGFVAGALGVLSLNLDLRASIERQHVMMLLGIGYAGADFIEGFVRKNLPAQTTPLLPGSPAGTQASSAPLDVDLQPPIG